MSDTVNWRLKAEVLKERGVRNTYHDIMQAAQYLIDAANEHDLLQDIIDGRPAINAGLPETYVRWSQSIYSGDAVRATMKGK